MEASLDQLRTLAAVVDEGTFDAASAALGVTPSAVSQRIKALETSVGRVLITRTKPVRVTGPGAAVLRLARTTTRLADDTAYDLGLGGGAGFARLPIAVNADSLATWFLPALARMPARQRAVFDVHLDDQDRTYELFTSESVLAAVTSIDRPVAGCAVTPLGSMRYLAVASPDFAAAALPDGLTDAAVADAPLIVFNRKDTLQHRFIQQVTGESLTPPTHFLPSTADFLNGIRLGMGWGMVPELQAEGEMARGTVVALAPDRPMDVPLFWQVWPLDSPPLRALTEVVLAAADVHLRPTASHGVRGWGPATRA
ncbi:MAG TPA: LysR family transcriptional regulator ArgP [Tetrasphaera sp.]|uniref:LysR family transcriptional regulator ArgP n=1 Tax=Nostocoides sp. TaxID=1917966 RepID=UPI002CA46EF3|nr:LysR family transcriptional regulator ArgP [Tetrasphaera sp.]HNQ06316.1 LysR family transcriptional regulator ArgP [Tetrasphaera sp.]